VYKSKHIKVSVAAQHQKQSEIEFKAKKGALLGVTLLSTGVLGNSFVATVSADNSKAATVQSSASSKTTSGEKTAAPSTTVTPVAKTADEINQEALLVIHGDLGNGDDRVQNLTTAGYDAPTVQNRVNEIYTEWGWSGAYQQAEQAIASSQASTAATATSSASSSTASNNSSVPATDVVSYAANQMAQNTGVSASQWVHVIMAESSGNPNATNASSGAYGLFQLLGHGEYQGMSVDAQIAMATQVYQTQGAGAWAETW
jgi:hypothetical protein